MSEYSGQSYFQTSATNTAVTFNLDARLGTINTLAIVMTTSAGTATVTVKGSQDANFVNLVTIDSIAAAGSTVKEYFMSTGTVGATTAVSPLAFPYIQVTVGTAGGGNTTSTYVMLK